MIGIIGTPLYQWDTGRSVRVTDIEADHVHFANKGDSKAVIMDLADSQSKIPDYLLQTGKQLCVYVVNNGKTVESRTFSVIRRERPEDYVYEEDQRNFIYALISSAEDATEAANQAAWVAAQAGKGAGESANRANAAAEAAEEAAKTAKCFLLIGGAKGTPIYLDDAADQYLYSGKIFGKTTQAVVPTPAAPVPMVSAGGDGSVNVRTAGKNLLRCSAVTTTSRGITFSVAADGTIVVNGTATENAYLTIGTINLHPGKYLLRGNSSGSSTTHRIFITNGTNEYNNYTADREFTVTESGTWTVRVLVNAGTTVSNLKIYPMVRLAAITDPEYERYKPATEMSISTPNGLCGIPVSTGGNYIDANGQQWICDEIDFARGVYVQRVGKSVVDGVKNPASKNDDSSTSYLYYSRVLDKNTGSPAFCTHFSHVGVYPSSVSNYGNFNVTITAHIVFFSGYGIVSGDNSTVSNANEFNNWLKAQNEAGTPVTVLYVLASPVETSLSAEEITAYGNLRTYRGHTTISNNSHAYMDLEYVMDAKKYIDSLVINPPAAKLSWVTLLASAWAGTDNLHSQVVNIEGITPYSKVDLLPSVEQLAIFQNKNVTFVTENDGGVVTVFAIGDKPTQNYTMQVQITEVLA